MVNNHKKGVMVGVIAAICLVTILGVTFAIWNYSRTLNNQILVTGDIYMKFKENNTLTIENALPREDYIPNKYFEFTIEGVNNYSKPIWYEIDLQHGEKPTDDKNKDRTERIKDSLLRFRLVEVVGEEEQEIFTDRGYEDLTNEKIHVDTINANTKTKITRTYRLYMWISNTTRIGVGENLDYDMETWNNKVYASIKVNVAGDFNEKEVDYYPPAQSASCFTTKEYMNYKFNTLNEEQIETCANYLENINFSSSASTNEDYKKYCAGEIIGDGRGSNIYDDFGNRIIDPKNLGDDIEDIISYFKENGIISEMYKGVAITAYEKSCGSDVVIPKKINNLQVTAITDSAFSSTTLNKIIFPNTLLAFIGTDKFGSSILSAGIFYESSLNDVTIPESVKFIGRRAFISSGINSIKIEDGTIFIMEYAFIGNNLTSVNIPNSVTKIGYGAFGSNQLTNVTIGNGIKRVDDAVFYKAAGNYQSNPNLTSITIDKTCSEIKNIEGIDVEWKEIDKYYPWLSSSYPYTATGVTIYGSNGDVCDTFE